MSHSWPMLILLLHVFKDHLIMPITFFSLLFGFIIACADIHVLLRGHVYLWVCFLFYILINRWGCGWPSREQMRDKKTDDSGGTDHKSRKPLMICNPVHDCSRNQTARYSHA